MAIPFSTGCVEFYQGILTCKPRGKGGTSLGLAGHLLAHAELQLALLRHTWALWEVWRWQDEELQGLLYPQLLPHLGVLSSCLLTRSEGGGHLKGRSPLAGQEVVQSPWFIHLSSHLGWINLSATCGAGYGVWWVTHFSGSHTPSKGCSARSFGELCWSMIMRLASPQLKQSARVGLETGVRSSTEIILFSWI